MGQTGRTIHERIREHLYAITYKTFKLSDISFHFNSINHDVDKHFEFFIFKTYILLGKERHYIENDLIQIILSLTGRILNSFIPRIYLMKKTLTFI